MNPDLITFWIVLGTALTSYACYYLSKRTVPTPPRRRVEPPARPVPNLSAWSLDNLPPGFVIQDGNQRGTHIFLRRGPNQWAVNNSTASRVTDEGIVAMLRSGAIAPVTQQEADAEALRWQEIEYNSEGVPAALNTTIATPEYTREMAEAFNRDFNAVFEDFNRTLREMTSPQEMSRSFQAMSQNIQDLVGSIRNPATLQRLQQRSQSQPTEEQITQSGQAVQYTPTMRVKMPVKKAQPKTQEPPAKTRLDRLLEDDDPV